MEQEDMGCSHCNGTGYRYCLVCDGHETIEDEDCTACRYGIVQCNCEE